MPTLFNFLRDHVGWSEEHGWAAYPQKGKQHKRQPGDQAAISSIAVNAEPAPKRQRTSGASAATAAPAAAAAATTIESASGAPAPAPTAAAAATTAEAASGAATTEAAFSAATTAASDAPRRSRCDVFRDETGDWTTDYEADDATETLVCKRCSDFRIELRGQANWKYNAEKHCESCRIKNPQIPQVTHAEQEPERAMMRSFFGVKEPEKII